MANANHDYEAGALPLMRDFTMIYEI